MQVLWNNRILYFYTRIRAMSGIRLSQGTKLETVLPENQYCYPEGAPCDHRATTAWTAHQRDFAASAGGGSGTAALGRRPEGAEHVSPGQRPGSPICNRQEPCRGETTVLCRVLHCGALSGLLWIASRYPGRCLGLSYRCLLGANNAARRPQCANRGYNRDEDKSQRKCVRPRIRKSGNLLTANEIRAYAPTDLTNQHAQYQNKQTTGELS